MRTTTGYLRKMLSNLNEEVSYQLPLSDQVVDLNGLIGNNIKLTFEGEIKCIECGAITPKSYFQGYCFKCFQSSPQTDECIHHPEKCKAHLGISRDQNWAVDHCLTPHIVYLAFSSQIKVGVTRLSQVPTRWIDQGATSAIILAQTPNRHIAGIIEVFLKNFYTDKTSWQQMLKSNTTPLDIDLLTEKQKVITLLPKPLQQFLSTENDIRNIFFPNHYESTNSIKSVSFDNLKEIGGILTGIKGQYLIIDNITALNIRKHQGYLITLESE